MTLTPDHIIARTQADADNEARFADAALKTLRELLSYTARPRPEQVLALASQYVHHVHRERAGVEAVFLLEMVADPNVAFRERWDCCDDHADGTLGVSDSCDTLLNVIGGEE